MSALPKPIPLRGVRESKTRWVTFLFLILVFFAANHDVRYSAKYTQIEANSAEWVATRVDEGYQPRRIALISLGAFALVSLLIVKRPQLATAKTSRRLLVLFVLLALMSVLWADDKALTFRRTTEFLILYLGALAITKRYKLHNLLELAFTGTLFYLIVGFISEVVLGKFAPFDAGYRFCGTLHPNHQGWNCAFLLLSSIYLAKHYKRYRRVFFMVALFALSFLILTKSRTSLGCTVFALFTYWALVSTRRQKIAFCYCTVTVFCLFLFVGGRLTSPTLRNDVLLGRSDSNPTTLSGRTLMWQASMPYIAERPLLGYGFNSFWSGGHIEAVSEAVGSVVPAAHCDYIGLLLGVGILGLVLFLAVLGFNLARFLRAYRDTARPGAAVGLTLLLFCCMSMTTEVIGFSTSLPTFIFYSLFLVNLPVGHHREQHHI